MPLSRLRDTWLPPSLELRPLGWLPFGDASGGMWYLAATAGLSRSALGRGALTLVPCAFLAPHLEWAFDEARLLELGRAARAGARRPRTPIAELLARPSVAYAQQGNPPEGNARLGTDELRRGPRTIPRDLVGAFCAQLVATEAQALSWPEDAVPELQSLRRTIPWQLLAPSALRVSRAFIGAHNALADTDVASLTALALAKQGAPRGERRTGRRRALPVADYETSLVRALLALQEHDSGFPAIQVYRRVAGLSSSWHRTHEKAKRANARALDSALGAVAIPFPAQSRSPSRLWPEYREDAHTLLACEQALDRGDIGAALDLESKASVAWRGLCREALDHWAASREFALHLVLLSGGEPAGLRPVEG